MLVVVVSKFHGGQAGGANNGCHGDTERYIQASLSNSPLLRLRRGNVDNLSATIAGTEFGKCNADSKWNKAFVKRGLETWRRWVEGSTDGGSADFRGGTEICMERGTGLAKQAD